MTVAAVVLRMLRMSLLAYSGRRQAGAGDVALHEWKLVMDDKYATECPCLDLRPDTDYEFYVQVRVKT